MKPLYFTLTNALPLMIIPDTEAHLDGREVIAHTYSVFRNNGTGNPLIVRSKESTLHPEHSNDPDYYGFITFGQSDQVFSYTADGQMELKPDEVAEIIEHLSDIRDHPALWIELG